MNCFKQDHIGNIAVQKVNGNYERRVYKKINLNFDERGCCCHALGYCRWGDLHTVLARHSSHHPFIHGAYSSSSFPLTANISVRVEGIGTEAAFPKSASVTRLRREDEPLAHLFSFPCEPGNLASRAH